MSKRTAAAAVPGVPPLAPSLARDLLPGDTTVLMTRFGSSSTGLLGWGMWKLRKSTWKVTDHDDHSLCILSLYFFVLISFFCEAVPTRRPILLHVYSKL